MPDPDFAMYTDIETIDAALTNWSRYEIGDLVNLGERAVEIARERAVQIEELERTNAELRDVGVPCALFCPECGFQHIDAPDPGKGWSNPPHRTHECQSCHHLWRPYPVATFGVDNGTMPPAFLDEIEELREIKRAFISLRAAAAGLMEAEFAARFDKAWDELGESVKEAEQIRAWEHLEESAKEAELVKADE